MILDVVGLDIVPRELTNVHYFVDFIMSIKRHKCGVIQVSIASNIACKLPLSETQTVVELHIN